MLPGKKPNYVAGHSLIPFLSPQAGDLSTRLESLSPQDEGLSTRVEGLSTRSEALSTRAKNLSTKVVIPKEIQYRISLLGSRTSNPYEIEQIIVELCRYKDLTLSEIAALLERNEKYIKNNYLKKLLEEGEIQYTLPEMISHPHQKYKAP